MTQSRCTATGVPAHKCSNIEINLHFKCYFHSQTVPICSIYLLSNWHSSHLACTSFTWAASDFDAPFCFFDWDWVTLVKRGVSGRFCPWLSCCISSGTARGSVAAGGCCSSSRALFMSLARPDAVLLSIPLKISLQSSLLKYRGFTVAYWYAPLGEGTNSS